MKSMREVDWGKVQREVPEWFRDAKFGLFFHWGPYSVPAYQNEWYSRNMYCRGWNRTGITRRHMVSSMTLATRISIP